MFLTKKGFWKILIVVICYFVLGSFCILMGAALAVLNAGPELLFILGAICYAFCPLIAVWGRYVEGQAKTINLGRKLVRNELKPSTFIEEYKRLRNATDLVINKPSFEVLQLVVVAYDALGDRKNCLSAIDEMIAVAGEKRKTFARLIKSSFLFDYNMVDEAEVLFEEACRSRRDLMSQALIDGILKNDRAMARGDYKAVELHNLKMLTQTIPKLDNLSKLVIHFRLGEVYEKLQDNEQAISYYQYCVDHGGETAIKEAAKSALEKIQ